MAAAEAALGQGKKEVNPARLAVVIVTFHSAEYIDDCLNALREADPAAQVIVVDNDSSDGSARRAESHPDVEVVRSGRNLGFAAAANLGAGHARASHLLFLNPDTIVDPGCLRAMAQRASVPGAGVVGCKIFAADGSTLQHAGGTVRRNGLTEHLGRGEADRGQFDEPGPIDYVSGAAMLLSLRTWRRLGGFDERFWPLYYEDVDLCLRVRALGLRVAMEPLATLRHHEGASSWQDGHGDLGDVAAPGASFYRAYHTNRLRFVRKHLGGLKRLATAFLLSELAWVARGGARGHAGPLIRSYRDAIRELFGVGGRPPFRP